MRLKYLFLLKSFALIWTLFMLIFVIYYHSKDPFQVRTRQLDQHVARVEEKLDNFSSDQDKLMQDIEKLQSFRLSNKEIVDNSISKEKGSEQKNDSPILPVLLIACNRQQAVKRSLEQLLKYRSSKRNFPIIVSQDCGHKPTTQTIRSFGNEVQLIQQPDLSDIPVQRNERKFVGYFKIARHYKWALDTVFRRGYDAVIIVEDDLDISPDFFSYFAASYPLLKSDSSLYCVSAWNDNGIDSLVDTVNGAALLHRSDFFPGLGWMLTRDVWGELSPKWPKSYWDDWIRAKEQRKGRSCIRPEISRTHTFGRKGVSNGLFFDKYLNKIVLNDRPVDFTQDDMMLLRKEVYDPKFLSDVRASRKVTPKQLINGAVTENSCQIIYETINEFKGIAKIFGLMSDFKDGVPRTSYLGVVSFFYRGKRVYLSPHEGWSGYDPTWT